MPADISNKLVIAISSRALFDLVESHQVFEESGVEAYGDYQIRNEHIPLEPGGAFGLVQKLLNLKDPDTNEPLVEVILLSRNSADTGLRVFHSIEHYNLNITRAAFTKGESPFEFISAFGAHLFLSTHGEDVRHALSAGCAAATLISGANRATHQTQVRIAFDGDAVIFSDESDAVYHKEGLEEFQAKEKSEANVPLEGGPFKGFLQALHTLQGLFSADDCPIRTALVTARGAPAHERVIRTLRAWDIRIDEAMFLGGLPKGEFLRAFNADVFFDDQTVHCESASAHVATAHVPVE